MTRSRCLSAAALLLVAASVMPPLSSPGAEGQIEVVRGKYGARASFCNAEPFFAAECDGKPSCEVAVDPHVCPDGVDPMEGRTKTLTLKSGGRVGDLASLEQERG